MATSAAANPADPLSQLRDIHLPAVVSGWPPGPGWWFAAVALLAALAALSFWQWRRRQRRAHRRAALRELEGHYRAWRESGRGGGDAGRYVQGMNAVLKRAAMAGCGRAAAGLSGAPWLDFLDSRWRRADSFWRRLGARWRQWEPPRFRDIYPPDSPYRPYPAAAPSQTPPAPPPTVSSKAESAKGTRADAHPVQPPSVSGNAESGKGAQADTPRPAAVASPPLNIDQLHRLSRRWLREYRQDNRAPSPC